MLVDIYHSEYVKDKHDAKEITYWTRSHDAYNGKDINSETKTTVTDCKDDEGVTE